MIYLFDRTYRSNISACIWRAIACCFVALLVSAPLSFRGAQTEALAVEWSPDCINKLMEQKDQFEKEHHGVIVEPNFRSCEPQLSVQEVQRYLQYIQEHDVGECAIAIPSSVTVSGRKPVLIALGNSIAELESFDAAFKRDNKFEAEIRVTLVSHSQCPAISFLRSLQRMELLKPQVSFEFHEFPSDTIQLGSTFEGWYNAPITAATHTEILIVHENGVVQNLTDFVEKENKYRAFKVQSKILLAGPGRTRSILIVFETPQTLESLRGRDGLHASDVFPALLHDVQRAGPSLTAFIKTYQIIQ